MVARWVVTRVGGDKYPKPRESKIDTTGAGAGCAPGRGGSFGSGCAWWWRSFLWARGGAGGVALSSWWWVGLVVAISLGSVKGGVGVEWWLGSWWGQ